MQISSKRRRTKKQIEEDKEEELIKQQHIKDSMDELDALRDRVRGLEREANNSKAAHKLVNKMMAAGHIVQDSEDSVIVHAAGGQQRFDVGND